MAKLFSDEMSDYFAQNQYGKYAKDIAAEMNEKFGCSLNAEQIKGYRNRYGFNSGISGKFEKGMKTWNKGKKFPGRTNSTSFKKGNVPHNHKPVGSERISKDGYIEVKVSDPNKWVLKHRLVWEEVNGKVPYGHAVIFKNQNRNDIRLENLLLVKRSELVELNKRKALEQTNEELTVAQINVIRIENKIKRIKKYDT